MPWKHRWPSTWFIIPSQIKAMDVITTLMDTRIILLASGAMKGGVFKATCCWYNSVLTEVNVKNLIVLEKGELGQFRVHLKTSPCAVCSESRNSRCLCWLLEKEWNGERKNSEEAQKSDKS